LDALESKFPKSLKLKKLEALLFERLDNIEDTRVALNSIFDESPADEFVLKRKVAIYRSNGMVPQAIKALNQYLKVYITDMEAFQELLDIYLTQQEYQNAGFCAEELILIEPYNYLYHLQYAEVFKIFSKFRFCTPWGILNWRESITQNL
jgi:ER membrane protein complex subunit 2